MCLLFLLLQVVAARLVTTDWAPFLYFTETVAGLGFGLGLALGASRFGKRTVAALAAAYTVFLLPWQLSGVSTEEHVLDRLSDVGEILLVSLRQFLQKQPVKDPLFFVMFVCLAFWLISLAAGYWLTRYGSVLASIVLAGAAIIVVQAYGSYQPHGSWWLAVFLLITLLLAGRMHYLTRMKDWSQRRVFVNEEAGSDVLGSLFMTAAAAILLAWLMPTTAASLQAAADTWTSLSRPIRERLSNAVTSLNGPYGKPSSNFYGSTLAVGQTAASGDAVVFRVKVLREPASTARYYWRGRVYDDYANGRWSTTSDASFVFQPAQGDVKIPDPGGRSEGSLQFTSEFPSQTLLYAPWPVVWASRSANVVALASAPDSYDALSWQSRTFISTGETYEVRAELSNPTVEDLRMTSETYPSWVTSHYLGVPAALQPALQTMAEEATAGMKNPYDKAAAITNYLRSSIVYSATVPLPPEGQDPVMWVLLNYKKGFCNYYASAEVLLLRSMGIPARLAVGFAQGEREDDAYAVRRRDAHAWPEAYFSGIGWIEFEPTVSQDPLIRPSAATETNAIPLNPPPRRPSAGEEGAFPEPSGSSTHGRPLPFIRTFAGRVVMIALAVLAILDLGYLAYRRRFLQRLPAFVARSLESSGLSAPPWIRTWERWSRAQPVERYFASINLSLRWLGRRVPLDATPADRAQVLAGLLPEAQENIETLRDELESGLYTPRRADLGRARRASLLILMRSLLMRVRRAAPRVDGRDVVLGRDH